MRCDLDQSRLAVWWSTEHVSTTMTSSSPGRVQAYFVPGQCVKLSAFAAQALADARQLDLKSLDPHRMDIPFGSVIETSISFIPGSKEYETRKNVTDPITGGGSAIFWTVTNYYAGIAQIF